MSIGMEGFGAQYATLAVSGELKVGEPVKLSGNCTVAPAASAGSFSGVLATLRGELGLVQLRGAVEVPYSGTAPAVGYAMLGADGTGGVKTVTTGGRMVDIVSVEDDKVTFIL